MARGEVIHAPFTLEQVEQLARYQLQGYLHPFTCGQRGDHVGDDVLIPGRDGWRCPHEGCDYTQTWAHAFMADREALDSFERSRQRLLGLLD